MLKTLQQDHRDRAEYDMARAAKADMAIRYIRDDTAQARSTSPQRSYPDDASNVLAFPPHGLALNTEERARHTLRVELEKRPIGWRGTIETWCARVDMAPDLANDIGSRKWLRGLVTMLALGTTALAFCPDFAAVESATAMPVSTHERDQFRSQSIRPLVLGGDSGWQMGATPLVQHLANVPERPTIQMVSTLGQGDTLGRMLERAGVGSTDATQVMGIVWQALGTDAIKSGTQFDITLGQRLSPNQPRMLESVNFRARFDLDLAIERNGNSLALLRQPIRVDETPLRIRGTVGSSLYRSARNAGAPVMAIQAYLRALDKYVSLESDLSQGDQFDMIVSYKRSAKGETQVGDLLYAGVERGGKPRLQLLRWGKDGEMFAANAVAQPRAINVGQPVAGRITSRYGFRRHPILGYQRLHAGTDYGAAYGSPIYAVADATVTYAGRHGGHGNYVRLEHGGGLGTGYAHMSRMAVSYGARVRAGQVIGYVGSTGLSTGPHLHFEAYRNGRTIDPTGIAVIARPQIDTHERDAFNAKIRSLMAVKPGHALGAITASQAVSTQGHREIDKLLPGVNAIGPDV